MNKQVMFLIIRNICTYIGISAVVGGILMVVVGIMAHTPINVMILNLLFTVSGIFFPIVITIIQSFDFSQIYHQEFQRQVTRDLDIIKWSAFSGLMVNIVLVIVCNMMSKRVLSIPLIPITFDVVAFSIGCVFYHIFYSVYHGIIILPRLKRSIEEEIKQETFATTPHANRFPA